MHRDAPPGSPYARVLPSGTIITRGSLKRGSHMRRIQLAAVFILCACALVMTGCDASEPRVSVTIDVGRDGTVVERISMRGADISEEALAAVEQTGWSVESSSPVEISHRFTNASDLSESEAGALEEVFVALRQDLGYEPAVRSDSVLDVATSDYVIVRKVTAVYEPVMVDFEPPYCLDCMGSGEHECAACSGAGTIVCPDCNGETTLVCPDCAGNGRVACEECGGEGFETCSSCDGAGWTECWWCDGDGWESCWDCGGDGVTTDWWTGEEETCDTCGGSGRETCDSCGGDGREECSSCGGDGREECWYCDGNGRLGCDTCDTTGRIDCELCAMTGSITCEDCLGEGALECGSCMGTGEVTSAQLARHDDAMSEATIEVALNMPGYVPDSASSRGSVRLSGLDLTETQSIEQSSWVLDWRWATVAGGVVLIALAATGWFGYRGVRRLFVRTPAPAVAYVVPTADAGPSVAGVAPAATDVAPAATDVAPAVTSSVCGACGTPHGEGARFCKSCGGPL